MQNAYTEILSASVTAGIKNSTVYELLDSKYSCISKLVWKEPASPYFGFSGKLSFSQFICNIGLNFSFPNNFGTMEDFDYYMSGEVCQYSKHTNHLDNDCSLCADFGYDFDIGKFSAVPFIGCCYQYRKFSASDGYLQIPETGNAWTGNEEKRTVSGTGICYEQNIFLLFIKLNVNYSFYRDFSITGSIKFSPYLFASCIDTHYFRNRQFFDKMNGGISFNGEIKFYFKQYGIFVSYEYLKSSKNAKTYTQGTGISDSKRTLSKNSIPGIESYIWCLGIEYKL